MKKPLLPSSLLVIALLMGMMPVAYADVGATYNKTCATCHDSGALGAPKRGDGAVWGRLHSQKGMDNLVKSVRQGMPQMPAMGLCQSCSDQDFKDLIEYMSK